uniref:Ig-like domain-containing protein n=1 Tax=Macrostomum lignano TaxID=282301 RepID=A0A1I8FA48_9PLAT
VSFVCAVPTSLRLQPLLNLPTRPGLPPCPPATRRSILPCLFTIIGLYRCVWLPWMPRVRQFTSLASLAVTVSTSDSQVATAGRCRRFDACAVDFAKAATCIGQRPAAHGGRRDSPARPADQLLRQGGRASAYLADVAGIFTLQPRIRLAHRGLGANNTRPIFNGRQRAGDRINCDSVRSVHGPGHAIGGAVTGLWRAPAALIMEDRLPLAPRDRLAQPAGRGDRPIPTRLIMDAGLPLSLRSEPPGLVSVAFDAAASKASNEGVELSAAQRGDAVGVARVQAECQGVAQQLGSGVSLSASPSAPSQCHPAGWQASCSCRLLAARLLRRFASRLCSMEPAGDSDRLRMAAVSQAGLVDAHRRGSRRICRFDFYSQCSVFPPAYGWVSVVPLAELEFTHAVAAIKVGNCVPLWARGSRRRRPDRIGNRNSGHVLFTGVWTGRDSRLRAKRMSAGVRLCGLSPGQAVVRLRLHPATRTSSGRSTRPSCQSAWWPPCQCRASAPSRSAWRLAAATICQPIARLATCAIALIETAQPVSHYQQQHSATGGHPQLLCQLTALNSHGSSLLTVSAESRWANQTLTMRYDGPELPRMRADLHHLPTGGLYGLRVAAFTCAGRPDSCGNPPLTARASRLTLCIVATLLIIALAVLPDSCRPRGSGARKSAVLPRRPRFSASADVLVSEPTVTLLASAPARAPCCRTAATLPPFSSRSPATALLRFASLAAAALSHAGNCTGAPAVALQRPKLVTKWTTGPPSGLPVLHASEPTLVSGGPSACLVRVQEPPPAAAAAPWWDADSDDFRQRRPFGIGFRMFVTAELPEPGAAAPPSPFRSGRCPAAQHADSDLRLKTAFAETAPAGARPSARQDCPVAKPLGLTCCCAPKPSRLLAMLKLTTMAECSGLPSPIAGCLTVSLRLTPSTALDGLSTSQDAVTVASSAASPSLLRSAAALDRLPAATLPLMPIGLSDASNRGLALYIDRSGAVLWSQGYGYTKLGDFSPVSPYRRSPNTKRLRVAAASAG